MNLNEHIKQISDLEYEYTRREVQEDKKYLLKTG